MNRKELDHYLIGEAWTSTEAYANLERLCDFGSRFAGSAGGRAARDFILERFTAYGLSQARLEPFDFLAWTRETGPKVTESFEIGIGLSRSVSCGCWRVPTPSQS